MNYPNEQIELKSEALSTPRVPPSPAAQGRGRGFGRPFQKGVSGNPLGRPRSQATMLAEALVHDSAKELTEKVIGLAREGNLAALKLCFDRLLPRQREFGPRLELPLVENAADCKAALAAVIDAVAAGELTLREAHTLLGLIEGQRRAIETNDFAEQLTQLEEEEAERRRNEPNYPIAGPWDRPA